MYRIFLFATLLNQGLSAQNYRVYIGTSSDKGIYVYDFDNGNLSFVQDIATQRNPSFIAVHPNKKFLYAANRGSVDLEQPKHGSISAFEIVAETGKLNLLNEVSSKGEGACHVALNHQGNVLATANYGSGSVTWYEVMDNGELGKMITHVQHTGSSINSDRQKGPHAHSAIPSIDDQYWYISDLGLDAVIAYQLKEGNFVEKSRFKAIPGSGPRHFKISADGNWAYSIEELSNTIQTLKVKKSGKLKAIQRISTLDNTNSEVNSCADIHLHPSEKFLVGSNRGANTLASFELESPGQLKFNSQHTSGGDWPRNFGFSPDGNYLISLNQRSDDLVVYKVNADKISFEEISRTKVPNPSCVIWVPLD